MEKKGNGESVTATIVRARANDALDDNDASLDGTVMRAQVIIIIFDFFFFVIFQKNKNKKFESKFFSTKKFTAPNFFDTLIGVDFGLRSFDCGVLQGCSGHGQVSFQFH